MTSTSEYSAGYQPTKILLKILHLGGKFSKVPERISYMLNGLEYYSLELTLNENCYYIQAFEQEAVELFKLVVDIRDKKNTNRYQ